MAHNARDNRISRRSWLLAGMALLLFQASAADEFPPPLFDGDNLQPALPHFHFLVGKPLERLKGGATVAFVAQLSLFTDDRHTTIKNGPLQRFILSQDIWNEHFKVTIPTVAPHDRIGLTASQAESWCLENMFISASEVPKDRPLWMRFTMRTVHQDDLSRVVGDKGISFLSIFEYLSRKAVASEQWIYESPRPFRLQDLPRLLFPRPARTG